MTPSTSPPTHSLNALNIIIEVPANGNSVKYEIDKASGLLKVDRFMPTAMHYPCDYGYIPETLAEDGDPIDALVMTPFRVQPHCLIPCRVLGMLHMVDEKGRDSKILAVPLESCCQQLAHLQSLKDVPESLKNTIVHFFENYKSLEPEKWVRVEQWAESTDAIQAILAAKKRYEAN